MKRVLIFALVLLLILLPAVAWAVPLEQIYSIIESYYVDAVDIQALRGAGPGDIGKALGDPYTMYFTPEEFDEFLDEYFGTYVGIGTLIGQYQGETVVVSVFSDSPAEKAGIMAGDIFVSVDGIPLTGVSFDVISRLLRGRLGSTVEILIRRGKQLLRKVVVRAVVEVPTVTALIMGDVAYLAIHSFTEQTPAAFAKKLEELQRFSPRGYILDLRDNPGGSLGAVVQIASEILPSGPVVFLRDRHGSEEKYENLKSGKSLPNLMVLVNEGSASGAEILAGAVQDYGIGVLIGQRTFGKASVQTLFSLNDGSGLKVTTARYFTPKGQAIDKSGLIPDLPVSAEEQLATALRRIRITSPTLVFSFKSNIAWSNQGEFVLDAAPYIEYGRSYIPLRALSETMGADVSWDAASWTATIRKGATEIKIPVGQSMGLRNGEEFNLLGKAVVKNGRLFIPARAVALALGGRVWWDGIRQEVIIDW